MPPPPRRTNAHNKPNTTKPATASANRASPSPDPFPLSSSTLSLYPAVPTPSQRWALNAVNNTSNIANQSSGNNSSSPANSLVSSSVSLSSSHWPPGFLSGDFASDGAQSKDKPQEALIYASAMATATAPGKQLLMTAFMLWMSGSGLQIFSIMMLAMAFWQPLQRLFNVEKEFARYDRQVNLLVPKLVFVACNLAGVSLALWKANGMGLLPNSIADWVDPAVRIAQQQAY